MGRPWAVSRESPLRLWYCSGLWFPHRSPTGLPYHGGSSQWVAHGSLMRFCPDPRGHPWVARRGSPVGTHGLGVPRPSATQYVLLVAHGASPMHHPWADLEPPMGRPWVAHDVTLVAHGLSMEITHYRFTTGRQWDAQQP